MSEDVNVSGTQAGGDTSAPAAPAAASTPAATAPASSVQATTQTQSTPSVPDGYIPRYRYNEASQRAEQAQAAVKQYEAQMAQVKSELDRYRSQVQALVGVTPQQNTEAETIKKQFFELFPWAKTLESRFGDIEGLLEKGSAMEDQVNHYWTSYGTQAMDRLFKMANESLGTPLTDEGKRLLHSQFVGFLESSPELAQRYATDPTVVEDFWKTFTSSFIDPTRRASAAGVQSRAAVASRLPQDSPAGTPQASQAPKLNNLDERAAAAWAEFQQKTGRV